MSRGHGALQHNLANLILQSPDPMTFAEIAAVAFPPGSYEADISRVGRVRSLRRALRRLCDDGTIMKIGDGGRGDPYRYWLNPMMVAMTGDKKFYRKLNKRIAADPALTAAANAIAKRLFKRA